MICLRVWLEHVHGPVRRSSFSINFDLTLHSQRTRSKTRKMDFPEGQYWLLVCSLIKPFTAMVRLLNHLSLLSRQRNTSTSASRDKRRVAVSLRAPCQGIAFWYGACGSVEPIEEAHCSEIDGFNWVKGALMMEVWRSGSLVGILLEGIARLTVFAWVVPARTIARVREDRAGGGGHEPDV